MKPAKGGSRVGVERDLHCSTGAGAVAILTSLCLLGCNGEPVDSSSGEQEKSDQAVAAVQPEEGEFSESALPKLPAIPPAAPEEDIHAAIDKGWEPKFAKPPSDFTYAKLLRVKVPLHSNWQNVVEAAKLGASQNPQDYRWNYFHFVSQLPDAWSPELDEQLIELLTLYGRVDELPYPRKTFTSSVPWAIPEMPERIDFPIRQLLIGGQSNGRFAFCNQRRSRLPTSTTIPVVPATLMQRDVAIHLLMQQMGYRERRAGPIVRRVCQIRNDTSFVIAGMAAGTISYSWARFHFRDDLMISAFAILDAWAQEFDLEWLSQTAQRLETSTPSLAVIAGLRGAEFGADGDVLFSDALELATSMGRHDFSWLAYAWRAALMLEFRRDERSGELLGRLELLFDKLDSEARSIHGGSVAFLELPLSERIRRTCIDLHRIHDLKVKPNRQLESLFPRKNYRDGMILRHQKNAKNTAGAWLVYRRGFLPDHLGRPSLSHGFIQSHCAASIDAISLGHWAEIAWLNGHFDLAGDLVRRARELNPDSKFLLQQELVIGKAVSQESLETDRWPLEWLSAGFEKLDEVDAIIESARAISQHLHNSNLEPPEGWKRVITGAVQSAADTPEDLRAAIRWVRKNNGLFTVYGAAIRDSPGLAWLALFADTESHLYDNVRSGAPFPLSRGSDRALADVILFEETVDVEVPMFSHDWLHPTALEFTALADRDGGWRAEMESQLQEGGLGADRMQAFQMLRDILWGELNPDEGWQWYSENRNRRDITFAVLRAFKDEKYSELVRKIMDQEFQTAESWDHLLQRKVAWYLKASTEIHGFATGTKELNELSLAAAMKFSIPHEIILEDIAKQPQAFFLSLQVAKDNGFQLFKDVNLRLISDPKEVFFFGFVEEPTLTESARMEAVPPLTDAMLQSQDSEIRFFPMTSHDGSKWCALGLLAKSWLPSHTRSMGGILAVEPPGFDAAFANEIESWDSAKREEFVIYANTRFGHAEWRKDAPQTAALLGEG